MTIALFSSQLPLIGHFGKRIARATRRDAALNCAKLVERWEQQTGEPDLWYGRFSSYRLMGTSRSLLRVYRDEGARMSANERDRAKSVPGAWRDAAKKWDWEARSTAWDKRQMSDRESSVVQARSRQIETRIALQDEWLTRESGLRDRAYQWLEDYIYGKVTQTRTTTKTKSGDDGCTTEESTIEIPQAPPQWMLQYFLGNRNHEKHLHNLYDLLKQILAIEGTSEELQQVKGLVQATLEGILLTEGADEIRLFIRPRL